MRSDHRSTLLSLSLQSCTGKESYPQESQDVCPLGVLELNALDIFLKNVIEKQDEKIWVVVEKVFERPVASEIEVFRRGEPLGMGILFLVSHAIEPVIFFHEQSASQVTFAELPLRLIRAGACRILHS